MITLESRRDFTLENYRLIAWERQSVSLSAAAIETIASSRESFMALLDSDPEQRAANLQKVTDGLALADEIGALCCVDIAGSYSDQQWVSGGISTQFVVPTIGPLNIGNSHSWFCHGPP